MKHSGLITTLFVLTAAVGLPGCYSLDLSSESEVTYAGFYKNQEQLDQAVAGAYSYLEQPYVFGFYWGFDCLSPICISDGWMTPFREARGEVAVKDDMNYAWVQCYEGIARANQLLQNIGKVKLSEELDARYRGEAKFLRAYFYFHLLDLFGGVPIYDESVVVADQYKDMMEPRSTADKVRTFILKDLADAEASLPEEGEWDSANYGRATRGAAQALAGKVLLYNKQYEEASKMFGKVISSNKYELYPDYAGIFRPGEGDESTEMVFALQYSDNSSQHYGSYSAVAFGNRSTMDFNGTGGGWQTIYPNPEFVDTYEYKDGRKWDWEEFAPGYTTTEAIRQKVWLSHISDDGKSVVSYTPYRNQLLAMYEQRDPRMAQTIILPYTHYLGFVQAKEKDCEYVLDWGAYGNRGTGLKQYGFVQTQNDYYTYCFRKMVPEGDWDGAITDRTSSPLNFPLIRYADVLLMMAECLNELDDPAGAVSYINRVRKRAGVALLNSAGCPDNIKATTKERIFERIKLERAWEFVGEGLGFSDYKRWGLLETMDGAEMQNITRNMTLYKRIVVSPRDYLWCIPYSEIQLNPSLQQNQGW